MNPRFIEDINNLISLDGRMCDYNTFKMIVDFIDSMPKPEPIKELNTDYYRARLLDYDGKVFFDILFYLKGDRTQSSPFKLEIKNQGIYKPK